MLSCVLLGVSLLHFSAADDTPAYEAAATRAGRDGAAHVRLALWCEAHGMNAERIKHLALAVLADPRDAAAHGLMGLVDDGGKWRRPEAVAERVRADAALSAKLAEYEARRARLANTGDAHWRLALWCEEQGLTPEATAHIVAVTRLDPAREAAWRRLGYKKHHGQWITDEQVHRARVDAEAQAKADRHWRPILEAWRKELGNKATRAAAEQASYGLIDPRAVPSIVRVFGKSDQVRAAQLLGQIDSPAATRALAAVAVYGDSAEARRAAAETLRCRDPREFVALLIAALRKPVNYDVKPVGGPGSPGVLVVEGNRFDVERVYAPPSAPSVPLEPGDTVTADANGLAVINRPLGIAVGPVQPIPETRTAAPGAPATAANGFVAGVGLQKTPLGQKLQANLAGTGGNTEPWPNALRRLAAGQADVSSDMYEPIYAQTLHIPVGAMALESSTAAVVAQGQLAHDVRALEQFNAEARSANAQVRTILQSTTGQDLGDDPIAWSKWWTNELGYATATQTTPRVTIVEQVPLAYQPTISPLIESQQVGGQLVHHSCFGGGTLVRTRTGSQPIEGVRPGDLVLTQDSHSGLLTFEPVVAAYHNPPAATLNIDVGGDLVVATPIHRFWKAGQGWVMARELKAGDTVRTLAGRALVRSVAPDRVQPVFNLEVARGSSFFVGTTGVLVHDNSLVFPTPEPFDAAPTLAAAGEEP
jgi:hypothetical protein